MACCRRPKDVADDASYVNWMGHKLLPAAGRYKISQIVFPGSWESGSCGWEKGCFRWHATQYASIIDQFKIGVRLFDFKVSDEKPGSDEVHVVREDKFSGELLPMIRDITTWLGKYPTELVMIRIMESVLHKLSPKGAVRVDTILAGQLGNMVINQETARQNSLQQLVQTNKRVVLLTKGIHLEQACDIECELRSLELNPIPETEDKLFEKVRALKKSQLSKPCKEWEFAVIDLPLMAKKGPSCLKCVCSFKKQYKQVLEETYTGDILKTLVPQNDAKEPAINGVCVGFATHRFVGRIIELTLARLKLLDAPAIADAFDYQKLNRKPGEGGIPSQGAPPLTPRDDEDEEEEDEDEEEEDD